MTILRNISFCIGLSILVAGCNTFIVPELGKIHDSYNDLKLVPQSKWNVRNTDIQLWTKHGPLLDRVDMFAGIEDGEELVNVYGKENPHKYKKSMTSLEVVELYKDSLSFLGAIDVQIGEISPIKVADQDGFEFEFSLRTIDGLKKKGIGRGTTRNEKLYLLVFVAPSIHYFDLVYDDARTLMNSAHFPENKEMAKK